MLRRAFSSNDETAQRSWDLADVSTDVCAGRVLCQLQGVHTWQAAFYWRLRRPTFADNDIRQVVDPAGSLRADA